jgi:Tol biopolymer transport system component
MILIFSSLSQANTNPNATIIPVANTTLEGYDLHHPEISPNDSLIAFSASEKGSWRKCTIWIYEVASGKSRQVTSEDSTMVWGDVLTRWSPDMTQLAFISDRGGESHAYVADISSGAIKKLTKTSLSEDLWMNRVAWSPDGTKGEFNLKVQFL